MDDGERWAEIDFDVVRELVSAKAEASPMLSRALTLCC